GGQVRPGSSPGTLTVTGNYTQGAAGALDIPVDGLGAGQFSVLSVGVNATLDGTLALAPSAGYAASSAPGDTVVGFLTYGGSRTGTFATTTANPPLSGGKSFMPTYVDGSKRVDAVVVGRPPAFSSGPPPGGTVGVPYSFDVTTSDTPTATISVDSGTLPPGLTLTDTGNDHATLHGTPTTAGSYTFTLRASNGVAPDATQQYTVLISLAVTGGGASSPSPTNSPSPSNSPSPTPSASSNVPTAGMLTTTTPEIEPTRTGLLQASGLTAGALYELRCYSRPSTTYVTARTATVSATGSTLAFSITPGTNTRCYLRPQSNDAVSSNSVVVNVRTTLSLTMVRTGLRTYLFQGRTLPRRSGQLITVYRIVGGDRIRTANQTTDSTGVYQMTRTFTGTGTFQFQSRSVRTLINAAGASRVITITLH
ncbi:MAG: Sortase, partial [Frankiales bacterium]|nr:Sortase [Frankiales bacterium]